MDHITLKAATSQVTDQGVFEAVISTETADREKDVVSADAMVTALKKWNRPLPLAWNHSSAAADIIGKVEPMTAMVKDGEVVVQGLVDLDSAVGREAWRSFKSRTIGFSFGYMALAHTKREGGGRHLTEVDVFEVTATPTPMNNDTRVLSTKGAAATAEAHERQVYELVTEGIDEPPPVAEDSIEIEDLVGEDELAGVANGELKAVWSAAYINDLPDSSFLYVEEGGHKDEQGKTTPRSKRHFPVKGPDGKVDLPHLRNALARIPQANLSAATKKTLTRKAQSMLDKEKAIAARVAATKVPDVGTPGDGERRVFELVAGDIGDQPTEIEKAARKAELDAAEKAAEAELQARVKARREEQAAEAAERAERERLAAVPVGTEGERKVFDVVAGDVGDEPTEAEKAVEQVTEAELEDLIAREAQAMVKQHLDRQELAAVPIGVEGQRRVFDAVVGDVPTWTPVKSNVRQVSAAELDELVTKKAQIMAQALVEQERLAAVEGGVAGQRRVFEMVTGGVPAASPLAEKAAELIPDSELEGLASGELTTAWSATYLKSLPDDCFLYVKGEDRHFPIAGQDGTVDLPHLRDALLRAIPHSDLAQDVKDRLTKRAQALAIKDVPDEDPVRGKSRTQDPPPNHDDQRRLYELATEGIVDAPPPSKTVVPVPEIPSTGDLDRAYYDTLLETLNIGEENR